MASKKKNLDLNKIFKKLNIKKGDKILVSSNLLEILMKLKKINQKFDGNLLINFLIKKVGPEGTLLFPTFNWDFCSGKDFNYKKTKSRCGALTNIALNRTDFKRTKNPIFSFAVTGKDTDYICNLKHSNCFGHNSPFGYLIKNNGKNIFIGMDYKDGFAFVHLAEEKIGVDYRYLKFFSGNYINSANKKRKKKYSLYVRNLKTNIESTIIDKKFDKVLIKKKAVQKKIINGINFALVDIKNTYKLMIKDIKNKEGLIYPKKKQNNE